MSEPIKYQCALLVGGTYYYCIESYESVFERIRGASFRITDGEDDSAGMRFLEPVELTVGLTVSEEGDKRLVRAAFAPGAVSALYEIPADIANEAP